MRMKRKFLYILVPSLLATFALASCGADTGDQEGLPNRTALGPLTEAATTTVLPDPTQTPELPLPGSVAATAPLPEYVRLDLEDGIVVAFADDPSLGRIAYVTHVPSGAQAVLDAKGNMIGREDSPGKDSTALDFALASGDVVARIKTGLRYDGPLPRDPIGDWIDIIRFDGVVYSSESNHDFNESHLGLVLYRVAFSLDANVLPIGYQIRDGDATYLGPGTAIYSLDGYDPSP